MPPRRTSSSSSLAGRWLLPVALLALVAGGIGGTLWLAGYFEQKSPVSREGQLAFPALARPVRAYDAIRREDLINPQTKQLNVTWIPKDQANPAMIRDLSQILGRVVTRDKQPGYVLTERDLFPEGTRPGIAAGIPPGKRSVTVNIADVPGLELLHQGDVFDLLAVLPEQDAPESNIEQAALLGGVKPPDTRSGQLARQAGIKALVIGGTMVAITQGKNRSTDGSQGIVVPPAQNRSKGTQSMLATIAVDPVEVSPLTEALGLDLDLYCVARSGHPEDRPVAAESVSLEGLLPVVTLARPVESFNLITQDDLADPVTGRLNIYYFPPEQIKEGWLTGFTELNGRVPARDLSRGAVITEADLMPVGTPPGIASAAPEGASVLTVTTDRLPGLAEFDVGSRLSVYEVLAEEQRPAFPITDWAALQGAVLSTEEARLQEALRQGITLVAGEVVLLKKVEEHDDAVVVAVPSESVIRFSQAINSSTRLLIAAHAGPAVANPWATRNSTAASVDLTSAVQSSAVVAGPALRRDSGLPVLTNETRSGIPAGYVAIPVTARSIEAWSRVQVSDFVDPATGRLRIMFFPEERVTAEWVTDLDSLIDRVAVHRIDVGRAVRLNDLAPLGAQPGPSAGIPPGMVGVHVTGDQVQGLDEAVRLNGGDRFKFITGRRYDLSGLGATSRMALTGGDAIEQSVDTNSIRLADMSLLVEEALLVEIGEPTRVTRSNVVSRSETTAQTVLTPDGPVRTETTRSEPEVVDSQLETRSYLFAVRPGDVAALTEAVFTRTQIVAIPLCGVPDRGFSNTRGIVRGDSESSGRPPDEDASSADGIQSVSDGGTVVTTASGDLGVSTWGQSRVSGPRVIEHIRGTTVSREIWTSPRSQHSPAGESPSIPSVP